MCSHSYSFIGIAMVAHRADVALESAIAWPVMDGALMIGLSHALMHNITSGELSD
ncbi:hypothetical protein [Hoeflea sp.]|uniref:hypothetical protein n=1 Tax=Hoeflea sp. TaxID=1940281 RepID=UPI003262BA37